MLLQRHNVQNIVLVFLIPCTLSTDCYYPDGSDAKEIPCPDPVSLSCCPANAHCLTNGLCWDSRNILFRGSCRDRSWDDPNCPKFCVKCRPGSTRSTQESRLTDFFFLSVNPSSGKVFAPCNNSGSFACDYNCTSNDLISIPLGDIIFISTSYTSSSLFPITTTSSTLSSLPQFTTTSSTFSSLSIITTISSTPRSPSLILVPDGNCTKNVPNQTSTNGSPNLAAVTAGIAVPLGIAWLATLFLSGRQRRKMRLFEQEKSGRSRDNQHAKWIGNSHGVGGDGTELSEDRALNELPVGSSAYEMQG